MKHFVEQGFHHDLFCFEWERIKLNADVENVWKFFYDGFIEINDKHAGLRKYRVKGRDDAWFTPELANLLHDRNLV